MPKDKRRYRRDILIAITAVFLVFYVAAFSGVWGDRNYKTNFWPNFFEYSGYVVGVLLLTGWAIWWFGGNSKKR
jgi:hypothetical protein